MNEDIFKYLDYIVEGDGKSVVFNYQLTHGSDNHKFSEYLIFPDVLPKNDSLKRILRALHLALGISYYKIFLPPNISHAYAMTESEADFWNDVFTNGLGEFLYVNKLSKDQVAKFSAQDGTETSLNTDITLEEKAILGIGGGKDSIVAGELLKQINLPLTGFVMATGEQLGQSKSVADVMQIDLKSVSRTLDPQLIELQKREGAYHGHVPISLIFGLVGTALALTQNAAYVVVANEASSSTPTTEWQGEEVNHQWSKSFNFEKSLQAYIKQHVHPKLTYFSAIRPLSSIAIAKRFCKYPQYFEVFTSDNFVFRIDPSKRPNGRWSLESPKSLSSYILLAPWLSDHDLSRTFGIDFLDQPSLEPLFLELTGLSGHPPLDCVGTVDELVLSLNLIAEQHRHSNAYLMKLANGHGIIQSKDWQTVLEDMLESQSDQAFPSSLADSILAEINA